VISAVFFVVFLLKQYQFTNSNREQYYAYKNKPFIYAYAYIGYKKKKIA